MAAARLRLLLSTLLSTFVLAYSIKDGTEVNPCDYPGIVALVLPPANAVTCTGIKANGMLIVPQMCGEGITMFTATGELLLFYGDGKKNITIPGNSTGIVVNGIFQMPLPGPTEADCNGDAVLAESESVDMQSCQVVGYGSNVTEEVVIYDGILRAASLIKSTSAPCCRAIYNSLNSAERKGILDSSVPLNCVTSSGSSCGLSDYGGPVYCNSVASGKKVVVGLTANGPCESNGMFVVHDLTGSNSNFKFGISP